MHQTLLVDEGRSAHGLVGAQVELQGGLVVALLLLEPRRHVLLLGGGKVLVVRGAQLGQARKVARLRTTYTRRLARTAVTKAEQRRGPARAVSRRPT